MASTCGSQSLAPLGWQLFIRPSCSMLQRWGGTGKSKNTGDSIKTLSKTTKKKKRRQGRKERRKKGKKEGGRKKGEKERRKEGSTIKTKNPFWWASGQRETPGWRVPEERQPVLQPLQTSTHMYTHAHMQLHMQTYTCAPKR